MLTNELQYAANNLTVHNIIKLWFMASVYTNDVCVCVTFHATGISLTHTQMLMMKNGVFT